MWENSVVLETLEYEASLGLLPLSYIHSDDVSVIRTVRVLITDLTNLADLLWGTVWNLVHEVVMEHQVPGSWHWRSSQASIE